MCSSSLTFFLFLVFIHLISSTTAQSPICFDNVGSFANNSAYETQLKSVISSISTETKNYGFFNYSPPTNDTPHAMGVCRGDQRAEACQECLSNSAYYLRTACHNQKEALVYYDNCTWRYSNSSLLGKVVTVTDVSFVMIFNPANVSNADVFNQALADLLDKLRSEAASSDSRRKFAAGDKLASDFDTRIYAYVQCTPDLSREQCSDCLGATILKMNQCCTGKLSGRIMTPSCQFKFDTSPFLDPVEPLPPPTHGQQDRSPSPPDTGLTPPPSSPGGISDTAKTISISDTAKTIILIVLSAIVVALFVILFRVLRKRKSLQMVETEEEMDSIEVVQFDLGTIEAATNGFSDDNKLGQGGFGPVYKGKLFNGQEIAVKRLSRNSGQGVLEFKNEVKLLARLQHRNLVRLQGFCLDGIEKLLIYEFVPNSSLDHFIFDAIRCQLLNWETRHKIIIGIARGLLYLHEDSRLRIIHRDLKAGNILLDSEMNPKISDFGMAKLFAIDQTQTNTSRIVGTYGYMAPEYAIHGNFSLKSDVFSFGVLVLEIVSGKKNNLFCHEESGENLLSYAWRNWTESSVTNIIDPILGFESRDEMARCIHIGLLCVQENAADRPTMASIILMLNSFSTTVVAPSQPAFFIHGDNEFEMSTTQEDTSRESNMNQSKNKMRNISKNDVSITELYPL